MTKSPDIYFLAQLCTWFWEIAWMISSLWAQIGSPCLLISEKPSSPAPSAGLGEIKPFAGT